MEALGKPFNIDSEITSYAYTVAEQIEDHLNVEITKWSKSVLNSKDSRFVFKRECMCDVGVFLQKKRYVIHVLDDEGFAVNKFKYIELRSTKKKVPFKNSIE